MKSYPSIPKTQDLSDSSIYVWDKPDGSLIRTEWKPKKGFAKFGSRHVLMDASHPFLGGAIELIQAQEEKLAKIFQAQRWGEAVCFFEYHSPNSFAGYHIDEPHQITLFDVNVYKIGILKTSEFYRTFQETELIPKLLHRGRVGPDLIEQVRSSTLEGMTLEGVVCKSPTSGRMFKIKSRAWLDRLREFCRGDEQLFEKLA